MNMNSLNARIEWLCAALSKSKLDNEQQQRELDNRDEQNRRLDATLAERDEQIQLLESENAALKEQIRDSLTEQAPSPLDLPVCIVKYRF